MAVRPRSLFFPAFRLGAALLLGTVGVRAAPVPIPHGTVELLAEKQWITPGSEITLGLNFQLEKGWHIYWVNPGDSGEPPRVTWHLPAGLTAGAIEWPTPQRLGSSTVVDFGYPDGVLLLIPMRTSRSLPPQQPVQIAAEVKVLVCREMCVPGKAQLSLSLPVKPQPPAPNPRSPALFAAARKALPRPAPANWRFSATDADDSFVLTGRVGRRITEAVFFPLEESQIDNAAPQQFTPVVTGFRLVLRKSAQLLKPIARLRGVLVLSVGEAYRIDAPVGKAGAGTQHDGLEIQPEQSFVEGIHR